MSEAYHVVFHADSRGPPDSWRLADLLAKDGQPLLPSST